MVDVHVGQALGDVVRARSHLLVRDDFEAYLVPVVSDGGVETGERPVQVFVHPPVADGAVVAGAAHDGRELSAQEGHFLQRRADYAGAGVQVLLREPVLPDVRGLHRVVVDGDDLREGRAGRGRLHGLHTAHGSADLTVRQLLASYPSAAHPLSVRHRRTPVRPLAGRPEWSSVCGYVGRVCEDPVVSRAAACDRRLARLTHPP